ncbi:MAG: hypothetical protein AB7P76_10355 [Candidatus Melainabacteria bacterium]
MPYTTIPPQTLPAQPAAQPMPQQPAAITQAPALAATPVAPSKTAPAPASVASAPAAAMPAPVAPQAPSMPTVAPSFGARHTRRRVFGTIGTLGLLGAGGAAVAWPGSSSAQEPTVAVQVAGLEKPVNATYSVTPGNGNLNAMWVTENNHLQGYVSKDYMEHAVPNFPDSNDKNLTVWQLPGDGTRTPQDRKLTVDFDQLIGDTALDGDHTGFNFDIDITDALQASDPLNLDAGDCESGYPFQADITGIPDAELPTTLTWPSQLTDTAGETPISQDGEFKYGEPCEVTTTTETPPGTTTPPTTVPPTTTTSTTTPPTTIPPTTAPPTTQPPVTTAPPTTVPPTTTSTTTPPTTTTRPPHPTPTVQRAQLVGDPLAVEADGGQYYLDLPDNKDRAYTNVLSDKGISYTPDFRRASGNRIYNESAGILLNGHHVELNPGSNQASSVPSVDGRALAVGETVNLGDGATASYGYYNPQVENRRTGALENAYGEAQLGLKTENAEHTIYVIPTLSDKDGRVYLNSYMEYRNDPATDDVRPHGILGQTYDADNIPRERGTALEFRLAEGGPIVGVAPPDNDDALNQYIVADPWNPKNWFNQYGGETTKV